MLGIAEFTLEAIDKSKDQFNGFCGQEVGISVLITSGEFRTQSVAGFLIVAGAAAGAVLLLRKQKSIIPSEVAPWHSCQLWVATSQW
ncbi:hypothetical protein PQX77_002075 [Marasmius sp. AFHP31]|nr:hypothetical protein PQX77_002075 [Marasmius sp. AFHP31]